MLYCHQILIMLRRIKLNDFVVNDTHFDPLQKLANKKVYRCLRNTYSELLAHTGIKNTKFPSNFGIIYHAVFFN